jgi:hypothetical protein
MQAIMHPLALGWLVCTALVAGCSSTAGMLLSGSASQNVSTNEQALARPKYAAWIAAGAKRCGFARDPEAIKSAYLSFEAKQGATKEQLANLEEAYNLTWKSTYDQIGADADFCTNRKVAEIKLALGRQDTSDYAPNFPKPEVNNCGALGCAPSRRADEPFNAKKFWEEKAKEPMPAP